MEYFFFTLNIFLNTECNFFLNPALPSSERHANSFVSQKSSLKDGGDAIATEYKETLNKL